RAAGERAVDPEALMLYSERQYAARGFPFVPFTRDLEVYWAEGRELVSLEPTWVPASLVYPNYFVDTLAHEPRTHFVNLSGIAAGGGREDAERSALEEVIERDAVTVWWISGSPPDLLDLSSEPRLVAAMTPSRPDDPLPLDYQLFAVPNVFDVPVFGALLRDPKHDIVTIGVASRADPVTGALKALAEAVHLRGYSRELLAEDGKVWQLMGDGILDRRVYKSFRSDRRYMDDYRDDFHDVVDLGCHAQIYLDPRMQRHLSRFDDAATGGKGSKPLAAVTPIPEADRADLRATYLRRLGNEGITAYSVDVTTPDVESVGLSVVRVVAPGLYGNAPAAFPMLGGRRLYEDPVRLGLLGRAPSEDEL
ncbi:MAG: YcaO-like family protein, partial [Acidobacteriota bacterium]